MKHNLDLLFQNQEFKSSLRVSKGTSPKPNKGSEGTLQKKSRNSVSASKMDQSTEDYSTPNTKKQKQKAFSKKSDIVPPRKHNFSEIYQNYVKQRGDKQHMPIVHHGSLTTPTNDLLNSLIEARDSQQPRMSNKARLSESKTGRQFGSQSEFSFVGFEKEFGELVGMIDDGRIDYDYDQIDFFEFLSCLMENNTNKH